MQLTTYTLRTPWPLQVNPSLADRLEGGAKLKDEHKRVRPPLVAAYFNQIAALIALELGVHLLHQLPYVGRFARPVVRPRPAAAGRHPLQQALEPS